MQDLSVRPYRLRARQSAMYLSIAVSHFYALVARGHLPKPTKVGRMSFWNPAELEIAFEAYANGESLAVKPFSANERERMRQNLLARTTE